MTEKMKIIEVEKIRDILAMKLFSNNNSKYGLCLTFFSPPYHRGTTQHFIKFWEKIGNKLGRKNITNIILH